MKRPCKIVLFLGLLSGPFAAAANAQPPDDAKAESRGMRARRPEAADRREQAPVNWRRMSESERKELRHFIEEHFPRLAAELDHVHAESPQSYERRMQRIATEMRRLKEVMKKDPPRGQALIRERRLSLEMNELARRHRESSDAAARAELRGKIRELAAQEFEFRMERRDLEVRALEVKLAGLKERLAEMKSLRDEMLDRRTRELLERKPRRPSETKGVGDEDPIPAPTKEGESGRAEEP